MSLVTMLTAVSVNWKGLDIECDYSLGVDGAGVLPSNTDPAHPQWLLPITGKSVTIIATPTVDTYWPTTVTLTVGADGRLTPDAAAAPWVTVADLSTVAAVLTKTTIVVSRFKDVSDQVVPLFDSPPPTRQGKPATVQKDYADTYGTWPPSNGLELEDQAGVNYLDLPAPAQGVSFSPDPSVQVKGDDVVLQLAGVVAPKLWGVHWPDAVARSDASEPTPFLVFLRQGNAQYKGTFFTGDGLAPYPFNFDYATFGCYDDMAYPDGDVFRQPGSKGVPYQAAKAGACVVTVHPVNSLNEDFGVIESTRQLGRILLELQAFMFRDSGIAASPTAVGKTAIASFSSGTHILARILARSDNLAEPFLSTTVSAVYFLDAPQWSVGDCVTAAIVWSKVSTGGGRVRFYTQTLWDPLKKILPAPLPTPPFIATSSAGDRTLGYVPTASWPGFVTATIGATLAPSDVWQYTHHAIAATMLSHALSLGDV